MEGAIIGSPTATGVGFLNILTQCTILAHTIVYKFDRWHANDHIRQTRKGTIIEVTEPSVPEFTRIHDNMNLSLDRVSSKTVNITF